MKDQFKILEVNNISKKYGKNTILSNVSFKASLGECIAIVGANGAGKSTLLKILSGVDKPSGGSLFFYDIDSFDIGHFSSFIGYVPQENPLFENLSVMDNLRLWYCETDCNLKYEMTEGKLKNLGLWESRKKIVSKLSGGMKKRVSIACSIAKEPSILILDEPGASLDLICKRDICNFLSDYCKKGNVVIISSHEECELAICDRMLLIDDCTLREIEPVNGNALYELLQNQKH